VNNLSTSKTPVILSEGTHHPNKVVRFVILSEAARILCEQRSRRACPEPAEGTPMNSESPELFELFSTDNSAGCPIHAALSHAGVPSERLLLVGVDEWAIAQMRDPLLGTPSLKAWPSKGLATKGGFSPWGIHSDRRNGPKKAIDDLKQATA